MDIITGKEKVDWNRFIIDNGGSFLQSWEWGEFQKETGKKVWRIVDGGNWLAQIIKHDLPLGKSYLYCPGGPIAKKISNIQYPISNEALEKFIDGARKIVEEDSAIFLKIEPMYEINIGEVGLPAGSPTSKYWEESGFIKSFGIQRIQKTLVLDLTKSEEQLLTEMKQKTRYNIRLAEKQGVKIRISDFRAERGSKVLRAKRAGSYNPEKDVDAFYELMQETAERNKIRIHSKEYYLTQILTDKKQIGADNGLSADFKLFLAEYSNEIIAANIVVFFGNRAIYLHGGSSNEYRNLMAPYLLQWEQIKETKKRGCELYDFWGIDEEKWPGITRFKKGFGGKEVFYTGAYDYVFQPRWYGMYKLAKKIF